MVWPEPAVVAEFERPVITGFCGDSGVRGELESLSFSGRLTHLESRPPDAPNYCFEG